MSGPHTPGIKLQAQLDLAGEPASEHRNDRYVDGRLAALFHSAGNGDLIQVHQ